MFLWGRTGGREEGREKGRGSEGRGGRWGSLKRASTFYYGFFLCPGILKSVGGITDAGRGSRHPTRHGTARARRARPLAMGFSPIGASDAPCARARGDPAPCGDGRAASRPFACGLRWVCRGPGAHGTMVHRAHQQPQLLRVRVPRFHYWYYTSVTDYKTVGAYALYALSIFDY